MDLISFNSQLKKKEQSGEIEEEYSLLQEFGNEMQEKKSRQTAQLDVNKPKNRFVDILPCKGLLKRFLDIHFYGNHF